MLAYRFPAAHQNRGAIPAVLEQGRIRIEDGNEIVLGKFIGSGSYGMVFLDETGGLVIKIEANPDNGKETMEYLMDLNHWASEFDVGPKFGEWGPLRIDLGQLAALQAMSMKDRPDWLDDPNPIQLYYSVYEKWDMDLDNYIGDRNMYKRFKSIPLSVMERFVARIAKLHSRAVVHLDLAAKNVFVRVKDDIVQDMVLGDYGLSRPRTAWFFDETMGFRQRLSDYYANEMLGETWAGHMDRVGNFNEWFLSEPFNADWCLVGAYALATNWTSMVTRLQRMPPPFNFDLPWDSKGWLRVTVGTDEEEAEIDVHGLMSLAHLRESLKKLGKFQMGSLQFQAERRVIPIKDERTHYPSEVIQERPDAFFIALKGRRGKK